jgi:8-oxo-dGTP pyrophosphatase MutT (NUDIX family)
MNKFKNKPNSSVIVDGEEKWLSRSTAVVLTVILNDEKVLILKRGKIVSNSGKWCNPCGYLDWNESGYQCALRECWEETGLDLKDIIENKPDCIKFQSMIYPWDIVTNPELNHNQDIALYYGIHIHLDEEPLVHNKNAEEGEVDEVKWVTFDKLKNYEFSFNHDKRILKYLKYITENQIS